MRIDALRDDTASAAPRSRTCKFAKQDRGSQIEVLLEPVPEGIRITLHHTNVLDGHTGCQDIGWRQHYFEPMKQYFSDAR